MFVVVDVVDFNVVVVDMKHGNVPIFPAKQSVPIFHHSLPKRMNAAPAGIAIRFRRGGMVRPPRRMNRPRTTIRSTGFSSSFETKADIGRRRWQYRLWHVVVVVTSANGGGYSLLLHFCSTTRRSRVDGPWGCFFCEIDWSRTTRPRCRIADNRQTSYYYRRNHCCCCCCRPPNGRWLLLLRHGLGRMKRREIGYQLVRFLILIIIIRNKAGARHVPEKL
jgi:hypothetical protein